MDKQQAFELVNRLDELSYEVEKLTEMVNTTKEECYAYNSDKTDDHWKIIHTYNRGALYTSIINDYAYKISDELKDIQEKISQTMNK